MSKVAIFSNIVFRLSVQASAQGVLSPPATLVALEMSFSDFDGFAAPVAGAFVFVPHRISSCYEPQYHSRVWGSI